MQVLNRKETLHLLMMPHWAVMATILQGLKKADTGDSEMSDFAWIDWSN